MRLPEGRREGGGDNARRQAHRMADDVLPVGRTGYAPTNDQGRGGATWVTPDTVGGERDRDTRRAGEEHGVSAFAHQPERGGMHGVQEQCMVPGTIEGHPQTHLSKLGARCSSPSLSPTATAWTTLTNDAHVTSILPSRIANTIDKIHCSIFDASTLFATGQNFSAHFPNGHAGLGRRPNLLTVGVLHKGNCRWPPLRPHPSAVQWRRQRICSVHTDWGAPEVAAPIYAVGVRIP